MIRVMLVDDSPLVLMLLRKMLDASPEIQVVGTAANGREALARIPDWQPQVICTDLHMPVMDGLLFTREVMAHHPLPILVVSVSVQNGDDDHTIFQLLEAGAIDVFPKPRGGLDNAIPEPLVRELIDKIKILSGVVPIRRHRRGLPGAVRAPLPSVAPSGRLRMVAIGASTGGPQALQAILSALPANLPVPVLCIQHISVGFLSEMINWLRHHTPLRVEMAKAGGTPQAGHVYFPPEESHLVIDRAGRFAYLGGESTEAFVLASPWHCPSIDVSFHSLAHHFGPGLMGILLTGMGRDGAEGLKVIADCGGVTLVQDEESCVVFGMPKQAIALGAAQRVLHLNEISDHLLNALNVATLAGR